MPHNTLMQALKQLLEQGESILTLANLEPTTVNTAIARWDRNQTLLDHTVLLVPGLRAHEMLDAALRPYFKPSADANLVAAGQIGRISHAAVVTDLVLPAEARFLAQPGLIRPFRKLAGTTYG